MSENRGRRRNRARFPGRVGEPNVLSNAATPNTLSGMARPSGSVQGSAAFQLGSRYPAAGRPVTGTTPSAPREGRRLPSFGTIIFIGFLILTGLRLLGEFLQGLAQETPAP